LHHHLPETKQKQERAPSGLRFDLPKINSGLENTPLVGLYSDVDIASICEAVVTTVCAGNPLDERNTGIQKLRRKSDATGIYDLYQTFETDSVQRHHVTVILDIAPGDWNFSCPPGAVQRVLMNLLGNSLKYTHAGHVRISLEIGSLIEQGNKKEKWHSLTMVVSDTGIGISESFLRNKLYSPFSQESILAPGTGKNPQVVRSIFRLGS
jgi:signal transduction histidine kinase